MTTASPSLRSFLYFPVLLLGLLSGGGMLYGQDATTPAAAFTTGTTGSLVSNGDFSRATQDPTWPDDWGKAKGISWETENGAHFLRLVAQGPGKMLMAYREINIPAGVKSLHIMIRYRTTGVVAGEQNWMDARAIFHFMGATGKPIPPNPKVLTFSNDSGGWVEASEQVAVPPGATQLVLMPSLFKVQAGILDLKEVSVTAVSS